VEGHVILHMYYHERSGKIHEHLKLWLLRLESMNAVPLSNVTASSVYRSWVSRKGNPSICNSIGNPVQHAVRTAQLQISMLSAFMYVVSL
jgi:hypothetical protein